MTQRHRIDHETVHSYQEANYFIQDTKTNEDICIRIGEFNQAVSNLLARHQAITGLIITAWNPHSKVMPKAENKARNQALENDALGTDDRVIKYPSYGADDQQTWQEEGFFFTHIDCQQAQTLCERYQQNAGVMVDIMHPPQLVWHPSVLLPDIF